MPIPNETADVTDPELNEPDIYGNRFCQNIDIMIGKEVEIKHARLQNTYKAFLEDVKYSDGTDEIEYLVDLLGGSEARLEAVKLLRKILYGVEELVDI